MSKTKKVNPVIEKEEKIAFASNKTVVGGLATITLKDLSGNIRFIKDGWGPWFRG